MSGASDPVAAADRVVGLYGDPTVSWSIGIDLALAAPQRADDLEGRLRDLVAEAPHLGLAPRVTTAGAATDVLSAFLAEPYAPSTPLLRVALLDEGRRVFLAAHHGAVDGLGLLAVAGCAIGVPLRTGARGIGTEAAPTGFMRSAVDRLIEALLRPPSRLASAKPGSPNGQQDAVSVRADKVDTTALTLAALRVLVGWNTQHAARSNRPVMALGISRRPGSDLRPDRSTAYARVRLSPTQTEREVRAEIAAVRPEPDFPVTAAAGIGRLITRVLRSRLGSTATVSNLGLIESDGQVRTVAFYPVAAGPNGWAVGLASASDGATVTVRLGAGRFPAGSASRLAAAVADELSGSPRDQ